MKTEDIKELFKNVSELAEAKSFIKN